LFLVFLFFVEVRGGLFAVTFGVALTGVSAPVQVVVVVVVHDGVSDGEENRLCVGGIRSFPAIIVGVEVKGFGDSILAQESYT
jgi:hypothetical protein